MNKHERRVTRQQQRSHEVVAEYRSEKFSGPVPSPEMLRQYEEIVPGLADRLIAQWEEQSRHRQSLERSHFGSLNKRADRGQLLAFLIVIVGIGSGTYMLMHGVQLGGLTAMLSPLTIVAGLFVGGKIFQRKDQKKKADEVDEAGEESR